MVEPIPSLGVEPSRIGRADGTKRPLRDLTSISVVHARGGSETESFRAHLFRGPRVLCSSVDRHRDAVEVVALDGILVAYAHPDQCGIGAVDLEGVTFGERDVAAG